MPIIGTLVIIDMQKGCQDPRHGARNNPAAEDNARTLLAAWRECGHPVIHVRHDSVTPGSPLRPEKPGNAVIDGLHELPGEPVLRKSVNSAFIGTDLTERLEKLGGKVVMAGAVTDHCVSTSVRMGANLGFDITLVEDACFCYAKRGPYGRMLSASTIHEANIASLAGECATITTTSDLIAEKESAT